MSCVRMKKKKTQMFLNYIASSREINSDVNGNYNTRVIIVFKYTFTVMAVIVFVSK